MSGKEKCKMLKDIRQKIADTNDIPYQTTECDFKGDCLGTCPQCESELKYIEEELARRKNLGKKVVAAGLITSMCAFNIGCASITKLLESMRDDLIMGAVSPIERAVEEDDDDDEDIESVVEDISIPEEEIDE